jgi:hypothetical protein
MRIRAFEIAKMQACPNYDPTIWKRRSQFKGRYSKRAF